MRIIAAHDGEGSIHHIVISPSDAPPATVTTETGLLMTEVEAPEVISKLDLKDADRSRQQLGKIVRHLEEFRVEAGAKAKLVPRKRAKTR